VRIGLLSEGGYPFATGDGYAWCDRLVRGLADHEFAVFCLTTDPAAEAADGLPPHAREVRTAPLWGAAAEGRPYGRHERRRFAEHFTSLALAITAAEPEAERFSSGLYGLAALARDTAGHLDGGLARALRSEQAVRILQTATRTPGSSRHAQRAGVADLLAVTDHLERALRPLTTGWYDGAGGLAGVDLCHALSGGPAALPGLLAGHFFGTPLLVTEYGVRLRRHYLAGGGGSTPVRALLAAFHRALAAEVYARAALLTPGNTHARRWQQRLGADASRQRKVYPGMAAERFAEVGEQTLVWVGRVEPSKDLIGLLHAFAEVRRAEPDARLLVVDRDAPSPNGYLDHCRALAAQLFPDEAPGAHQVGDNPVTFAEIGGPDAPDLPSAYAAGAVLVLSSVVEGFPTGLAEGMFCARASVSTDVGAVREVIGGTGLLVPPRNPRALAEACTALLRDPPRRARLGAAARARALELFTVDQNIASFRGIYLELMSHCPVHPASDDLPFTRPPEAHIPGRWAGPRTSRLTTWLPSRTPARKPTWSTHREPVGAGNGALR
jgi:glycosyltransferase involved in cell wall biosynthesis